MSIWRSLLIFGCLLTDSPGLPPSATSKELFKGFSFVAPSLMNEGEMEVDGASKTVSGTKNGNFSVFSKLRSKGISKCKGRSLSEYDFLDELGRGSFSVVKRAIHRETGQVYAVKVCCAFFSVSCCPFWSLTHSLTH